MPERAIRQSGRRRIIRHLNHPIIIGKVIRVVARFPFERNSNSGTDALAERGALDLGSRHASKLESVPAPIIDEVLARLAPIFD